MRFLLGWLLDQRSTFSGVLAIILIAISCILKFGYEIWWPAEIVMATVCGVIAMFGAGSE